MILVFIASPFRAATDWQRAENVRHAERAALEVWKAGACAVCPQANSALFHGECPDDVFLAGYRSLLLRCDAVYVAGQESEGVKAELAVATCPVFYDMPGLVAWLERSEAPLFHRG